MEKYELQQSTTQSTDHENAYLVKKRTFQEGDLEEGWTIVASRRTRRLSQPIVEDIQTEDAPMKLKPKKWPRYIRNLQPNSIFGRFCRSLWTIGAAAAVGLASIFIHRRLQRSQA